MRRLVIVLGLGIVFTTGCYDAAVGINSGLDDAFYRVGIVITTVFGVIGLLAIRSVMRDRIGVFTLASSWLLGGTVIALTALGTEWFHPWPGTFSTHAITIMCLPQPLAILPFVATARFIRDRVSAGRIAPWGGAVACMLVYIGLLVRASFGIVPPKVDGAIVEIAVSAQWSAARTDKGMVLSVFGSALPGRYKLLRGNDHAIVAINDAGRLVQLVDAWSEPVALDVDGPVRDVSVATTVVCAVDAHGSVRCFDTEPSHSHSFDKHGVAVPGYTDATDVVVSDHILCTRDAHGRATCNAFRIGDLDSGAVEPTKKASQYKLEGVVKGLAVARSSLCAINESGTVGCEGANDLSELGQAEDGKLASSDDLLPVLGLDDVEQIVAGDFHFCARFAKGKVACWGGNGWNQLGPTEVGGAHGAPVPIELPAPARELFSHRTSTCAALIDGRFYCWGAEVDRGAVFSGRTCDKPFFGPPVICTDKPSLVKLPDHAIPFRPQSGD